MKIMTSHYTGSGRTKFLTKRGLATLLECVDLLFCHLKVEIFSKIYKWWKKAV